MIDHVELATERLQGAKGDVNLQLKFTMRKTMKMNMENMDKKTTTNTMMRKLLLQDVDQGLFRLKVTEPKNLKPRDREVLSKVEIQTIRKRLQ